MMFDKQMLYKEKQVSNITYATLACDDDWQLEAHKMRDKYIIQKKSRNVTLASDDWQRVAPKVRQQIYYKKKIGIQPILLLPVMMILLKKDMPLQKVCIWEWVSSKGKAWYFCGGKGKLNWGYHYQGSEHFFSP